MARVDNPGVSQQQVAAWVAAIPTPATSAPPSVADSSSVGTQSAVYALANHTHASKARKARMTSAADGSLTWTFEPPFASGVVPIVVCVAETAQGVTDVVNVQVEGAPTSTSVKMRVNRTQRNTPALINITVLQVVPTPGATLVHAVALEP
jgi:hypothetical protein